MEQHILRPTKILIVDDSITDRTTYARYLKSDLENSFRITEVETLEEGLDIWRSQNPDLVLLDLNLPDGDGLDFLETISQEEFKGERGREHLPVIVLTGQGDEKIAVRAMKLGASDYLIKGDVTPISLNTAVKQVMRESELKQKLSMAYQELQQINQSLEVKVRERTQEIWQLNKIQRAILDGTDYAIISTDLNGIIQTFNTSAEKMFGYSMEEVVGKVTPQIFHDPTLLAHQIAKASEVLGQELNLEFESFILMVKHGLIDEESINIRKDGSRFPVSLSITILKDDDGQPIGTLSFRKDISDRKQIEAHLQRQARNKQVLWLITQAIRQPLDVSAILQIAVDELRGVFALDRVAVYRFQSDWNGEFVSESVSDDWVRLVGDDIHKVWEDTYLKETQGGRFRNRENMIVSDIYQANLQPCHIDLLEQFQARAYAIVPIFVGSELWGLLAMYQNAQPYKWETWEIELLEQIAEQLGIAIQQANLYEQIQAELLIRQQTEAQLLKVNEELLEATKLKDSFLANMSHELRTPLNSILGLSESLKDLVLGSLNAKQISAISTIESSGEHLLSLINDILDLSKISSGMMELDLESVSVSAICNSSIVFVKQQAFQKKIQLISNVPNHLNDIRVEARRMRQVLINLLTNAVKFTPDGGQVRLLVAAGSGDIWRGEATVPLQIRNQNSPMIIFQVQDTGIGIAANDLKRLFQPFVQIDSALNRQYEGTGLGLALVKQIVELHGGLVIAESELGKGSCFTIALPYEASINSVATKVSTAAPELPVANPNMEISPLVLIAEDNDANIQTFSAYLTALNYRVIIAKNGEEAVAMAKANLPNVILMDIQMPIMDGLEATKQIRLDANLINTPIIALTALAMQGDLERCLDAGANEYLAKPIKLKQLNATIQKLLS